MLLGVPVNPDGLACPRFTVRDLTRPSLSRNLNHYCYPILTVFQKHNLRGEPCVGSTGQRLNLEKIKNMLDWL